MSQNMAIFRSYLEAYEHFCKPLCRELDLPQKAFDILMFLEHHPGECTAKDINRRRGLKENILSVNINKLVNEGYLERAPVEGDRRKVRLVCTQKAQPVLARGDRLQKRFHQLIREGITAEELELCQHCLLTIGRNSKRIMEMDFAELEAAEAESLSRETAELEAAEAELLSRETAELEAAEAESLSRETAETNTARVESLSRGTAGEEEEKTNAAAEDGKDEHISMPHEGGLS